MDKTVSICTCATFTQLLHCAAACMLHCDIARCAANDGTLRAWFALRPRCECKLDAHTQSCNHVCACVCYTYVHVHGAALRRCVWCSRQDADYAAHMRLQLVLLRMSLQYRLTWHAVQVDVIAQRKGVCAYAWVRCRYGVYTSGCRVQDAGARWVSNAEGICRMVGKHDCALPAQYTKHSNARGHSLA